MALFGLMFLIVALILVGVGIVVGLLGAGVAAILVAVGVLSSSLVIGLLTRRYSTDVRALLLQCALAAGIPAGIFCAWLMRYLWSAGGPGWLVLFYGALGGALAGFIIGLLLGLHFSLVTPPGIRKVGSDRRDQVTSGIG